MKKVTLPVAGINRILLRGTNWVGDAVLTLPALSALRNTYAQAEISVLAKPWAADIYRLCPHVDEVMVYERPGRHEGMLGMLSLAAEIRARHYDLALSLQNAFEAAIIMRLAGVSLRAGYSTDGRGFLLTHGVRRKREVLKLHQTDYYLEMMRELGCREAQDGPYLRLTDEDAGDAAELLRREAIDETLPIVGMAPGATYGPAKKWLPERFAALADMLHREFAAQTLLFGSGADGETARVVQRHAKSALIDITGKTPLRAAVSLISRCRLFVSNDSGLMHVAGALDVPTVAIFGSTNPRTTSPLGARSVVLYRGVDCSPCLKETCPGDFRCMKLIETEEVFLKAREFLWKE